MPASKKIAFIGGGQMAEAMVAGLLASGVVEAPHLYVSDVSAERRALFKRRFGVEVGTDNLEAASWGEIVILAIKPQVLNAVLDGCAPALSYKLVLSVVAGVPLARLAAQVPEQTRLVRVMPNAPSIVREGASALAWNHDLSEEDREIARTVFGAIGRVVCVDESLMNAVTGLSGSGPAYVFMAAEALADGGVKMGLPRSVAELLAAHTFLGAARMLFETGEHPGSLKDRVASPGGTTIAGLHVLEQGRLRATLMAAVEAAARRAEEIGG